MPQFNIVTPTGVGIGKNAPDDNTIFRDSQDNTLAMIQNGYLYHLNPETILTPDEMKQAGTWGTALMMMNKKLGINPSNFPAYNVADLMDYLYQYHTSRGEAVRQGGDLIKDLSGSQAQQMISSGQIAKTDAGVKTLTATETPKIISGANGPVDANGNPINLEDYAKYGITDNKIPTTGGRVNTAGISQGGDSAEFQRYLKDKNITDPTVIAQYREQWQTMGAPPGYSDSGEPQTNTTGGVKRDLTAEQTFVKNWKGKDGRLPTPAEVNQGVYGMPNPQFSTGQVAEQTGGTSGATGGQGLASVPPEMKDYTGLPDSIKNADWYQGLSEEQKQILALSYNTITSTDEAQKAANQKALDEAISLADPYFKSQLLMAQDSIQRNIASTKADVSSSVGTLQTNINNLKEDLIYNREQLTLDQQQQLASLMNQYQEELSTMQTGFAESGLAFSSPRVEAEKRLAQERGTVAESINRKTQQGMREIETGTLRDIGAQTQNIADITRQGGEAVIGAIRQGEQAIGTTGVAPVAKTAGVSTIGTSTAPVTGSLDQEKQNAILGLQQTIEERQNPLTF